MKRKSILMTIVAVLFAGVAMGQKPWPTVADIAASAGSDTVYFCAPADSLYPIELGYDVAGKRLHPSFGNWTLHSQVGSVANASDYSFSATDKNGGAGNAFRLVGSGVGGYVFQYEAKDSLCGIDPGESFYVYVFVLPDLNNIITADTVFCPNPVSVTIPTPAVFPHADVYQAAGITYTWKHGSFNVDRSTKGSYVYYDTLTITAAPADYTCLTEGAFKLNVRIQDIVQVDPISVGICPEDTIPEVGKGFRDPNIVFGRTLGGTYIPNMINTGTAATPWTGGKQTYTYTYDDCDGNPLTVVDTLTFLLSQGDWGTDTVTICRVQGTGHIVYDVYHELTPRAALTEGNSHWFDRGLNGALPADYGTISGSSSQVASHTVNFDDMMSSVGYHYLWYGQFICALDSGMLVVILQDPFYAADYRVQMCKNHITTDFDLAKFTSIKGANWSYGGAAAIGPVAGDKLTAAQLTLLKFGTHKFKYKAAAACGAGADSAIMYLQIKDKPVIPSKDTQRFCKATLPASLNVNEMLGYVDPANTWTVTGTKAGAGPISPISLASAFTSDGILDLSKLGTELNLTAISGAIVTELTFVMTGSGCGITGTTIKVIITDNIL